MLALLGCGLAELVVRGALPWSSRGVGSVAIPGAVVLAATGVAALPALAWTAFKVGALSYGGGFVIIPLMQADAVDAYGWMTDQEFLNAVALGQITPGPVVQTVAGVGYAAAGLGGGLFAALIAFLPSFLIVGAGGTRFERLRRSTSARAFLDGAGPCRDRRDPRRGDPARGRDLRAVAGGGGGRRGRGAPRRSPGRRRGAARCRRDRRSRLRSRADRCHRSDEARGRQVRPVRHAGCVDQLFTPDPEPDRAARFSADAPLAARLRPQTIDEVVGQGHLLADGSALRTAIETGQPHSMLLYGPPGTGKTTLARIVARAANAAFEELSAVEAGRPEVRAVMARATERRRGGQHTVFFLDEIHRFNKAQQDALLPAVEEGLVTLIGATTENPSFEVNAALLSRVRLYELQSLTQDGVRTLLDRALERGEVGDVTVDPGALAFLADRSGGDARTALGALELAAGTAATSVPVGEQAVVTLEHAEDALQRRAIRFDKGGDQHYDTISAWIKATRASDPDASLYYLAVMLEAGEDPRFIARRMVILASEDIGLADPSALPVAVAAMQAAHMVGMPEAHYPLGPGRDPPRPRPEVQRRRRGPARGPRPRP